MTISLCMIVKNEERILERCLDSLRGLMDEIIIVDTGSTDSTKQTAARYTDKIYDFVWVNDFSAARNFAFSKATGDYIYSADADEVLDEENRERFRILKENLLPEIDIVQMKYGNQLSYGTVYNFDEEYRPKLFKRLRPFVWEEAIHEQVRLFPVVYDSEIVITHMPENDHSGRDLEIFRRQTEKTGCLSKRLHTMYAKELFFTGTEQDFVLAEPFFRQSAEHEDCDPDTFMEACLVAAHTARQQGAQDNFLKYSSKLIAGEGCSEICMEMGQYFEQLEDYSEAVLWYYNAAFETTPILKKTAGDKDPLEALIRIYRLLGMQEQVQHYEHLLEQLDTSVLLT